MSAKGGAPVSTQTAERPAAPVRSPRRTQATTVSVLIAPLLVLAAVLAPLHLTDPAYLPPVQIPWWGVALAFAATETFVLRIQARRETQTISFSEFPLVLGLFFATAP